MTHDCVLDKLANRINCTRADIKDLVTKLGSSDTAKDTKLGLSDMAKDTKLGLSDMAKDTDHGLTPNNPEPPIPLYPKQADYQFVNNWMREKYNRKRHPSQGDTPDKGNDPISGQYMEDQFSNVLPSSQ
jgi:hypothetical protein